MKNLVYLFAAFTCFLNIDATVKKGQFIADFRFFDDQGQLHCLSEHLGEKVVLIFYPNDSVPYCRLEAETLRGEFIKLQEMGITVFGINNQDAKDHLELRNRLKIPFPLLTVDKKIFKKFDVSDWFGEVKRKTFLIDERGILVKIIDDVKLRKHHLQILEGFGL